MEPLLLAACVLFVALVVALWAVVFLYLRWHMEKDRRINLRREIDWLAADAQRSREFFHERMGTAFFHGSRWQAKNPDRRATRADNPYLD